MPSCRASIIWMCISSYPGRLSKEAAWRAGGGIAVSPSPARAAFRALAISALRAARLTGFRPGPNGFMRGTRTGDGPVRGSRSRPRARYRGDLILDDQFIPNRFLAAVHCQQSNFGSGKSAVLLRGPGSVPQRAQQAVRQGADIGARRYRHDRQFDAVA